MEYIEYYRIIRERVWLVILAAGLAGLAVVAMQLVSGGTATSTAKGWVSVNDVTMRGMVAQGDQLTIGVDEEFWANIIQRGTGPTALSAILRELQYPGEAEDEYKIIIGASQLRNSNYLVFTCSSSDKDLTPNIVNTGMELWDKEWKRYKIEEADRAIGILEKRIPVLEGELTEAQAAVQTIEERHGGVAPVREAETLASSLTATQIAMQSASLETAAAAERSKALSTQPRRSAPGTETQNIAFIERIDDLNQQIMDREVLLADMLERRTKEHPSVKALERQIADLKKRTGTLEKAAADAQGNSSYLRESEIAARTYAQEMGARRELLAAREAELRSQLSKARTDLVEYEKAVSNVTALQKRYFSIRESIRSAKAELLARRNIDHMLTVEAEAKLDRPTGVLKQFAIRLVMALLGGAILGILALFVLHYIDTSFKNEAEAARLLVYPILGGIPHSDVEVIEGSAVEDAEPPGDDDSAGT